MNEKTVKGSKKPKSRLFQAMNLSLGIGFLMLFLKGGAFLLTGSSAILSDAAESVIHVIIVCFASFSLRLSHKPADINHPYGHSKITFFSAGIEGAMIVITALYILYTSIHNWITGIELKNLNWGTLLITTTILINGMLGFYLIQVGKQRNSFILISNGKHVLTDCWTSLGVLLSLALTLITGWLFWDPVFGVLMALNIIRSGFGLVRKSFAGLMDETDLSLHHEIETLLKTETKKRHISFHGLRHRNVGDNYLIEIHLVMPAKISLLEAHEIASQIEQIIQEKIKCTVEVITHMEPEGYE